MTTEQRQEAIEASGARPRSDKQPGIVGVSPSWAELDKLLEEPDQDIFNIQISLWTVLTQHALDKAKNEEEDLKKNSLANLVAIHAEISRCCIAIERLSAEKMTPGHKHTASTALRQVTETRDMVSGVVMEP